MHTISRKLLSIGLAFLLGYGKLFAQQPETVYPKVTGYFGIIHPIVTFSREKTETNFSNSYTVGFPNAVNILKSDKIGVSFEIVPFIKVEDGISRMNGLLFHPGVMFRRKNGFSMSARIAFETGGRFGFTPVFTKVIKKNKASNFYANLVAPARFGNQLPSTLTLGLQLGISY